MSDPDTDDRRILKRYFLAIVTVFVVLMLVGSVGMIRKARQRVELLAAFSRFEDYSVSASYEPYQYRPPLQIGGLIINRGGLRMHSGLSILGERPFWANWMATIVDNDPLAEVFGVEINSEQFSDADVLRLREIPRLHVVDLNLTGITDDGLAILAKFDKLTELKLNRTQISDRGLLMLDKLPELRELDIAGTKVTKEAVAAFRKRHPDCLVFD